MEMVLPSCNKRRFMIKGEVHNPNVRVEKYPEPNCYNQEDYGAYAEWQDWDSLNSANIASPELPYWIIPIHEESRNWSVTKYHIFKCNFCGLPFKGGKYQKSCKTCSIYPNGTKVSIEIKDLKAVLL